MKSRLLFTIVFIIASVSFASAQVRIRCYYGQKYYGTILKDSADEVVIKTYEGEKVILGKAYIIGIDSNVDASEANGPTSFPLVGGSLGTPAALHLIGGYYMGPIGARASLGYLGRLYGAQLNLYRNLTRKEGFSQNLGIAAGYSNIPHFVFDENTSRIFVDRTMTWTYISAVYDVNVNGIFGEIGLSFGSGSFSNPQLMLQVGYVFEFRQD
jgi:hypothetical protein